jgi:hypothetical protein
MAFPRSEAGVNPASFSAAPPPIAAEKVRTDPAAARLLIAPGRLSVLDK